MNNPNQHPDAAYPTVRPGTELNQTYRIDSLIGIGGMGEVFRGHNIHTGDAVAIKIVLPEFARDELKLDLFRKEAQILHHLAHDAIVRYYGFSYDAAMGRPYLAMEFSDGPSLAERMRTQPLSLDECTVLRRRVADGLQRAHEAGIIHRDISPDNVILPGGRVDRAKIIDFGIAKSANVGGGTLLGGSFAGKYSFVSPEQLGLFGADVAAKSDVYSFGLVLAAAVLGRPLDMSGSQVEVIEKRRVVPDLSGVPAEMRELLHAMLEPDPADRMESMAAVRDWRAGAAASYPESEPTVIAPSRLEAAKPRKTVLPPQTKKVAEAAPRKSSRMLIGLVAALAAIMLGTLAGLYYVQVPGSKAPAPLEVVKITPPTVQSQETNSANPEIKGTWDEGKAKSLTVKIGQKSYTLGSDPELTSKTGTWVLKPATPLAQGANAVTAESDDGNGQAMASASPGEIVVDSVPPEAPSVNPIEITGPPVILTGTWAEGDATVLAVHLDGRTWTLGKDAELTSDGKGRWTLKADLTLKPGKYDVTTEAFDKAGNSATDTSADDVIVEGPAPPVVPVPEPPEPVVPEPPEIVVPEPPKTVDTVPPGPLTVESFAINYQGGECFLAIPRGTPEATGLVIAYGNSRQEFENFTSSYREAFNADPNARFSQLTDKQCPVLKLAAQISRSNVEKPWLQLLKINLRGSKIANGAELVGTVEGLRQSSRYLLAFDDEGAIINLTPRLTNSGNGLAFSQKFTVNEQGRGRSQLIMALSSAVPLSELDSAGVAVAAPAFEALLATLGGTEIEAAIDMKTFSVE